MNIGVLCSGGDSPGMNAAIRSAVRQGLALEARMVGFRYGFDGIINADYMELAARSVGGILDQGGTFLGTGRSARFMTEDGPQAAVDQLAALDVDRLVVIGGDGSMRGPVRSAPWVCPWWECPAPSTTIFTARRPPSVLTPA